jgi:fucose permease
MSSLGSRRVAIAVLFFVNGMLFSTWASRIPGIKETLRLSEAELGLALLALGLGTFLGLPATSWLIARHGSAIITVAGAVACCAALPLAGRAPSLPLLAVVLALFGATLGCMDVAMNAQAALLEGAAGRSLMASFHGLWSFGGLVGASLGSLVADVHPPRVHFLAVCVALLVLSAAAARGLTRDTREAPPASPLAWPSRTVLTIGLVGACGSIVEGGIADWSGVYLRDALGTGAGFAAAGYAAFSLAMMAGRFTGDRLIDRFGHVALLRAGALVAGVAVATALWAGNPWVAIACFAVAGLGVSTVFPIAFGLAGRAGDTAPGHAIAAVATMAYGGGLLGPPLIGFTARATSLPLALGVLVLGSVAMAALAGRAAAAGRRDIVSEPADVLEAKGER